jgi:hypothetical protein
MSATLAAFIESNGYVPDSSAIQAGRQPTTRADFWDGV